MTSAATSFEKTLHLSLNSSEVERVRRAINLSVLGHEDCNVRSGGRLVPRPGTTPDQMRTLLGAHRLVSTALPLRVRVTVDPSTGDITYSMPPTTVRAADRFDEERDRDYLAEVLETCQ